MEEVGIHPYHANLLGKFKVYPPSKTSESSRKNKEKGTIGKRLDDQNISFRFESQEVKRSIECSNPINKIEKICHSLHKTSAGTRYFCKAVWKRNNRQGILHQHKNRSTFVERNFENPIKMSHHIRFSPRQHFAWNGWTLHVSATTKGWYRKLNAGVFCQMYF